MKKFNINYTIKVKLTPFGEEVYSHRLDYLNAILINKGIKPIEPTQLKKDSDGFAEFQLWDFMNIFGEHFRMGQKNILESNNIYFDRYQPEEVDNTVDVVEVVRCKDCRKSYERPLNLYWCDKWKNVFRGHDYCSFGERKQST